MQVRKESVPTGAGPADLFTGTVYIDAIATPAGPYRVNVSNVHFAPGARTAWHAHPNGQTVWVTEGVARVGRRGEMEEATPGDRVFFEPGEEHWHGAAPDRFMTHLSVVQVDEHGSTATWGEHVSDAEYHGE